MAKRLVEPRRHFGKGLKIHVNSRRTARCLRPLSSEALVRAYEEDADRKRILIRRAEAAKGMLMFVAEALKRLLLGNARVVRHLASTYPDVLAEFQKISEIQKAA